MVKSRITTQTNTLAILSLVFGILFFFPFAPIIAIIFGFLALGQISRSGEKGKGLAIAGICLGFLWIFLFVLILLIFFTIISTVLVSIFSAI